MRSYLKSRYLLTDRELETPPLSPLISQALNPVNLTTTTAIRSDRVINIFRFSGTTETIIKMRRCVSRQGVEVDGNADHEKAGNPESIRDAHDVNRYNAFISKYLG